MARPVCGSPTSHGRTFFAWASAPRAPSSRASSLSCASRRSFLTTLLGPEIQLFSGLPWSLFKKRKIEMGRLGIGNTALVFQHFSLPSGRSCPRDWRKLYTPQILVSTERDVPDASDASAKY